MGSGLAFCSCCPSLLKHTILGLIHLWCQMKLQMKKKMWETLVFLGVWKSPMKLVTGGIKVRESFGWIFGLAFLWCSFPGSKRPQVNGSEVKGPNYNITYDFLCLTKMDTSFLRILLNKCSFSLFKEILFCVYVHTCVNAYNVWVPTEAGRACHIPQNWTYKWLWAARGCWELNSGLLEGQHLLSTMGQSFKSCIPVCFPALFLNNDVMDVPYRTTYSDVGPF